MSFSGGGIGDSSNTTDQTAKNFQVGNSGSGQSVGGTGNTTYIQNTDVDAVKASLDASTSVTNMALSSGLTATHDAIGGVVNIAGQALNDNTNNANLAISANTALSENFADQLTKSQASNIGLLSSVSDSLTGLESQNSQIANAALQSAMSVAQGAAPQTGAYENEQVSATISSGVKWAVIAAAIVGIAYALK